MMRRARGAACLAAILTMACPRERPEVPGPEEPAATRPAETAPGVTLDPGVAARMGIRTVTLGPAARTAEVAWPGLIVPDPGAVAVVRAAVTGRLMETEVRWPRFGDLVSAGQVLGQVGDALPLAAPLGGTISRLGARPGELVQAGQELLEITDYTQLLVQVAWPEGLRPPRPAAVRVSLGERRWTARPIGAAAEADPLTRVPAWLYRIVDPAADLRPGTAVTVHAADPTGQRGLLVPAAAAVQWDGLLWAYREPSPGHFIRVRLPTDRPVADGWLVAPGDFNPGDQVVTVGAGQLLSEEFRTRIVVGEEVGE